MTRLPPHLAAEALDRLLRNARHPRQLGRDPVDHALALRAWIRAAMLDRHGWRIGFDADRVLCVQIGRERIALES